jgi:hypothetical protein
VGLEGKARPPARPSVSTLVPPLPSALEGKARPPARPSVSTLVPPLPSALEGKARPPAVSVGRFDPLIPFAFRSNCTLVILCSFVCSTRCGGCFFALFAVFTSAGHDRWRESASPISSQRGAIPSPSPRPPHPALPRSPHTHQPHPAPLLCRRRCAPHASPGTRFGRTARPAFPPCTPCHPPYTPTIRLHQV